MLSLPLYYMFVYSLNLVRLTLILKLPSKQEVTPKVLILRSV